MAFVHGRTTYIALTNNNLSAYVTTSQIESNSDSHDVTTYGQTAHKFKGGLTNGTATMSGIYDSSTTASPRAIITPLIGANTTLIRRPEGAGTGLAQDSVEVLVTKYVETNPVADMVTWSCDMQLAGAVTRTLQT